MSPAGPRRPRRPRGWSRPAPGRRARAGPPEPPDVVAIEAQHRDLERRALAFERSLPGATRQEVGILLSYLRHHAMIHFGTEEEVMRTTRFDGYAAHRAEHDAFVRRLVELSAAHVRRKGSGLDPAAVAGWLRGWLDAHLAGFDAALRAHLQAHRLDADRPRLRLLRGGRGPA